MAITTHSSNWIVLHRVFSFQVLHFPSQARTYHSNLAIHVRSTKCGCSYSFGFELRTEVRVVDGSRRLQGLLVAGYRLCPCLRFALILGLVKGLHTSVPLYCVQLGASTDSGLPLSSGCSLNGCCGANQASLASFQARLAVWSRLHRRPAL